MAEVTTRTIGTAPRFSASNLESVLDEQGRKRRWLADRVGVSESLISKVLAGKHTVSHELGERIAAVLGVPFFVLFKLHERNDDASAEKQASAADEP